MGDFFGFFFLLGCSMAIYHLPKLLLPFYREKMVSLAVVTEFKPNFEQWKLWLTLIPFGLFGLGICGLGVVQATETGLNGAALLICLPAAVGFFRGLISLLLQVVDLTRGLRFRDAYFVRETAVSVSLLQIGAAILLILFTLLLNLNPSL